MNRATEIAAQKWIGPGTLNTTTHWMRAALTMAGSRKRIYWNLLDQYRIMHAGMGAKSGGIGNNPFIMAVPRNKDI